MTSPAIDAPRGLQAPPAPVAPAAQHTSWRLLGATASGLLVYLAFPPVGAWPLAGVGLALLLLCLRGATWRTAALLGLLHGLALFLPLVEWAAANAGLFALIALALLQALFFAVYGPLAALVLRLPGWPLWCATVWMLQEAVRSRFPFGGFTWGRLAFSQSDGPLLPWASVGGAPLLSFLVALLGALLAWVVLAAAGRSTTPTGAAPRTSYGTAARRTAVLAVAVLVSWAGGALLPLPVNGTPVQVAVVQGNVPRLGLGFNDQRAAVLANHVSATRALAADVRAGRVVRPQLVIWPENASDVDPFTDPMAFAAISGAVKDVGVPVLVGALVQRSDGRIDNSGIVWDPVTGPGARYVKRHPVPFGEYIPFRSLIRRFTDRVDLVPRDFAAGTSAGVLQVGPARLGDVICFEVAYDDLVRDVITQGGRLLVVQTNNATFGRSAETRQQLAMSRLRAVEHGRSVLVAATSGISAIIAPDGHVQQEAPVFTRKVLTMQVPLREAQSLATRVGAWPEAALSLLGAGAVLAAADRRRRTAVAA